MRELSVSEANMASGGEYVTQTVTVYGRRNGGVSPFYGLQAMQAANADGGGGGQGGFNGTLTNQNGETSQVFVAPNGSIWDNESSYLEDQAHGDTCEAWTGVVAYGGVVAAGGAAAVVLGGTGTPFAVAGAVIAGVGGVGAWANDCF